MDKIRYGEFKKLMEAIKNIDYNSIDISDYEKYFKVTITIWQEEKE